MPHWPKPWGRDAGAVEQLVIEQEFAAAGIKRPALRHHRLGDPHADPARHRRPGGALGAAGARTRSVIWCQLFSEPDAGSDAAGVKTQGHPGRRRLAGQRPEGVDERRARQASYGLATVRTNPDVPKHDGITTMVIDMHAEGVEVRPLRMPTGTVGVQRGVLRRRVRPRRRRRRPGRRRLDRRPRHARQREREHRRRPGRDDAARATTLIAPFDAHPERLAGGAGADRPLHRRARRRWTC